MADAISPLAERVRGAFLLADEPPAPRTLGSGRIVAPSSTAMSAVE
jgi:hypothetical protein